MLFLVFILFLVYIYKKTHGVRFSLDDREPIFGVYREPSNFSPFKFLVMYVFLTIRKTLNYVQQGDEEDDPREITSDTKFKKSTGLGKGSRPTPLLMDCVQTLSNHPKAIDAVYFNGANRDGWHLIGATARRPNGVVNGFLVVKIPGIGLLTLPKMPDTMLFQSHSDEGFGAEGLTFEPIQAMAAWKIKYEGFVRVEESESENYKVGKLIKIKIDALWSSSLGYFDYDTDASPITMAKAISKEPWSREYFDNLKRIHQTHYEQYGDMSGKIELPEQTIDFSMETVRDHSYGELREWKHLHRYALHFITLESGARINVSVISFPVAFSSIEFGYMYNPDGTVVPIDGHTFKLHEHGESGTPPTDYAFSFIADGEVYHVKVRATELTTFYIGWEWEAKIIENVCQYEVNGIKGWGCAEFQYRHLQGRPEAYKQSDSDLKK